MSVKDQHWIVRFAKLLTTRFKAELTARIRPRKSSIEDIKGGRLPELVEGFVRGSCSAPYACNGAATAEAAPTKFKLLGGFELHIARLNNPNETSYLFARSQITRPECNVSKAKACSQLSMTLRSSAAACHRYVSDLNNALEPDLVGCEPAHLDVSGDMHRASPGGTLERQ